MDEYAGRILAGRYRLPRLPADELALMETRAFDTYSGQEVLARQLLLPEVVEAELDAADVEAAGPRPDGPSHAGDSARRALEAARAAAAIPDHPALVQVFDVFAEAGSLWVVSELVAARPVAALIAERSLTPYRAAEIAADVLGGLRALHTHGWSHRNITARTVLVCDDGRAILDGLAFGAAQEALCGYDPVPEEVLAAADGGEVPRRTAWGSLRRPESPLALERARQARITVVGPVTERWSPEQAGPVGEKGQPTPPIGPAADLWALGSLLYRCVLGHAPYPEESAAELVQLVCAAPPALAEECGPLHPVVETLLRQDPAERPEFEELRGRLRWLIRSAPEPGIGSRTVQVPCDPRKLPVVRRRGELVRLRRRRKPQRAPSAPAHGRHARGRGGARHDGVGGTMPVAQPSSRPAHPPARGARSSSPRRLGVWLLGLILLALVAFLVYAVAFMPRNDGGTAHAQPPSPAGGVAPPSPGRSAPSSPSQNAPTPSDRSATQTPALGPQFSLRRDPAGFSLAVHNGWTRSVRGNEVVFSGVGGAYQLVVALGEGSADASGDSPMTYQLGGEPQLADYRASQWASSSGMRQLDTGDGPAAEGDFTYRRPGSGSQVTACNLAVLRGGTFDVVFLVGPADQETEITDDFTAAVQTFHAGR